MKKTVELVYHKGQNFGDALNPYIFEYYLGNNFSESGQLKLIGIGTILGLKKHIPDLKIVFSSGASRGNEDTYGEAPQIDESYDIICVRGPMSANLLGIDEKYAICDGAYLLNDFYDYKVEKKYKYAYMPHHKSEDMFSKLKELFDDLGIKYISPSDSYQQVLKDLAQCEKVITEAMHGAIVADAFRIPWIPVKSYPFIDDFKWNDFVASMSIKSFRFDYLPKLHNIAFFEKIIKNKMKVSILSKLGGIIIYRLRCFAYKRKIRSIIKEDNFYISDENILLEKTGQLKVKMEELKLKYF